MLVILMFYDSSWCTLSENVPKIKLSYPHFYQVQYSGMCEKNKLRVYRELKEVFECKKYLYGVPDMGYKLLFRFRSGTHGLNGGL